jgi:hypothetical protein
VARILERLDPITSLILTAGDPAAICQTMVAAVEAGDVEGLIAATGDRSLAIPAFRYAGILTAGQELTPEARDILIRLDTLIIVRSVETDRWVPVMTVPAYLRLALAEGQVPETFPVLTDLISSARKRLVIASPFLDPGFERLAPGVERLVHEGGTCTLITRELLVEDSHNAKAVARLRSRCGNASALDVVSWEEGGLGLHMKVVVVDSCRAYIGSANFTWGGMGQHAEMGVRLDGPSVPMIEQLLDKLADELRGRRRLHAR